MVPEQMNVLELQTGCQNRKDRKSHEPFCFELFRRAIVKRNQACWRVVYMIYIRLIISWVGDSLPPGIDRIDIAQSALAQFARSYDAHKISKAKGLGDVLRYLKRCTVNEFLQAVRRSQSRVQEIEVDEDKPESGEGYDYDTEMMATHIWAVIEETCQDKQELAIADARLRRDMKPQEIVHMYSKLFTTAAEVNKVWKRLHGRLKRNPRLRQLWAEN